VIRGSNLRWNDHGEPSFTLTAEGWDDVYRFAFNLVHDQCEFADVGFKVVDRLRRKVGRERWRRFMAHFHGDEKAKAWDPLDAGIVHKRVVVDIADLRAVLDSAAPRKFGDVPFAAAAEFQRLLDVLELAEQTDSQDDG
jgi:hypothetical protein